nr:MAG TPA: hypothetical protein [Caudoviricetes sp.]
MQHTNLINKNKDFNPRAPCGARLLLSKLYFLLTNFNPRAPCGARRHVRAANRSPIDFNPRAPCGARPFILW